MALCSVHEVVNPLRRGRMGVPAFKHLERLQSSKDTNRQIPKRSPVYSCLNLNSRVLRIAKSGEGRVKARIRVFPKKGILKVKRS